MTPRLQGIPENSMETNGRGSAYYAMPCHAMPMIARVLYSIFGQELGIGIGSSRTMAGLWLFCFNLQWRGKSFIINVKRFPARIMGHATQTGHKLHHSLYGCVVVWLCVALSEFSQDNENNETKKKFHKRDDKAAANFDAHFVAKYL